MQHEVDGHLDIYADGFATVCTGLPFGRTFYHADSLFVEVFIHATEDGDVGYRTITFNDDGTYAEDVEHLLTLGNWLRNRCDVLTEAWRLAAESDDPSSVSSQVVSTLTGGRDYARLFDQNYDDWRPERAGSGAAAPHGRAVRGERFAGANSMWTLASAEYVKPNAY